MFIQTENTPNPNTLKFIPGCILSTEGPVDFPTPASTARSPLAKRLFAIEGVDGILIGDSFVTVAKNPDMEWYILKPSILGALMEHLVAKRPIFADVSEVPPVPDEPIEFDPKDADLVQEIQTLLDTKIRPAVAMDGGDITFAKYENGIVYLRMKGSCSGCPSSSATLKSGIENMLKYYVPEVTDVQQI